MNSRAKRIREKVEDELEREKSYCKLLNIPKPLTLNITGPEIKIVKIPPEFVTVSWVFRWIYTYSERELEDGVKLKTLRDYLKKGKIKSKRGFKRASYTTSVRNGSPEKCSDKLIEVDFSMI